MSICQSFEARARAEGLIVPDAGSGLTLAGSGFYSHFRDQAITREANVEAFLRGATPYGLRLDSALAKLPAAERTDSVRRRIAESQARTLEWARYIAERKGRRLDSTIPMASQGLTFFYKEVYEQEYADLPMWQGLYLPIDKRVAPAAETYAWAERDLVGLPRAASTYDTTTIPVVGGPSATWQTGQIVPFLVAMETNFMDDRREALAKANGKPDLQIELSKQKACQRVLAEAVNSLWSYGDPNINLLGLHNHPGIQTAGIVGTWASKSPLQIREDLELMFNMIPNATMGQLGDRRKIRLLLPPTQAQLLSQPMTGAATQSILAFFLESHKGKISPDQIEEMQDLAAANSQMWYGGPPGLATDTAYTIYADNDPDKDPMFVLPQPIEVPAPPRQGGLGEVRFYHVRAGSFRMPDGRRVIRWRGL